MAPSNKFFRRVKVLEQAWLCQKLRKNGMTIRQIAELVDLSAMTVWRRLQIKTPVNTPKWCNFQWRSDRNG